MYTLNQIIAWAVLSTIFISGAGANPVNELAWFDDNWHYRLVCGADGCADSAGDMTSINVNGNPRIYYLDYDGMVHELAWSDNSWQYTPIGDEADAVPAYGGLTATIVDGTPRVYYIGDDDNMVRELAWRDNSWHYKPVGSDAVARFSHDTPGPAIGRLTSTTFDGNPRVYYVGLDQMIHELACYGDKWYYRPIGDEACADPVDEWSLTSTKDVSDDYRVYSVYYISVDDFMVNELYWDSGDFCTASPMEHDADAVQAFGGLTSITIDGYPRVYYVGDDYTVHELGWGWVDEKWCYRNVGREAGAELALGGLTSTKDKGGNPHIYYIGRDYLVHEIAWRGHFWHHKNVGADVIDWFPSAPPVRGDLTATTLDGNPRVYYSD